MRTTKRVIASLATAALAGSMLCIAPAAAQAASIAAPNKAAVATSSTYMTMATSTTSATVKANEKRELKFYLNYKKIKGTKVTWKSDNKKVATVSKKGYVTTKKEGKVTVTGKYKGHTIYYKLTVKGDAKFDAVSKSLKSFIKTAAGKASYAENEKFYEYTYTEEGKTYTLRYSETFNKFTVIYDNGSYTSALEFSATYSDKKCKLTSYQNNNDSLAKSVVLNKSSYKRTTTYDFSSDTELNKQLNATTYGLMVATDVIFKDGLGFGLKDLGFTSMK